VGDMGKAHRIHAVVNNCQAEHQSTVLETTGTIADQTLSVLIDPSATESFISGAALKRIKVKAVDQNEFSFVEMASGAKQKVGWNQGVSLRFISSLQLQKSMYKGCKLYAILALNEKGVAEGIEHLPVVKEFADVFPEELPGMPPERELEFTIDLKPGTEQIARTPYRMSTLELQELKM
jgi:hypothetical protein